MRKNDSIPNSVLGKDTGQSSFKSMTAYLEHLTTIVMHDHNSSDYALLQEYLSDDFEQIDASPHECAFPPSSTREQHIQNTINFKKTDPHWKLTVCNVTPNLLKGSNTAEVWLTVRGSGNSKSMTLNRESVSVLHWRRRRDDGKWVCYRHTGLRGAGDFFE